MPIAGTIMGKVAGLIGRALRGEDQAGAGSLVRSIY